TRRSQVQVLPPLLKDPETPIVSGFFFFSIVHQEFIARLVFDMHCRAHTFIPAPVVLTELSQQVSIHMPLPVLFPQQSARHSGFPEFLLHVWEKSIKLIKLRIWWPLCSLDVTIRGTTCPKSTE